MCFKKRTYIFIGLVTIVVSMTLAFSEPSQSTSKSIVVNDSLVKKIIVDAFDQALSEGAFEVGGGMVKTDGQIISSAEDLRTVLVYEVQDFLDYDFATDGISRLINEANLRYETLVTEQSAVEDVVMRTQIIEDKPSSGFMTSGINKFNPMVFDEKMTSAYLKALGIESYESIYYLKVRNMRFSGILMKTQGIYRIVPLGVEYVHFKYADVKVMGAEVYFGALKSYVKEQMRMKHRRYGLKRLGDGETDPTLWILKGVVGLGMVFGIFGLWVIRSLRVNDRKGLMKNDKSKAVLLSVDNYVAMEVALEYISDIKLAEMAESRLSTDTFVEAEDFFKELSEDGEVPD